MKYKVGIIGAGKMGSALYKGLSMVVSESHIFVCDKDPKKANELKKEGIGCTDVLLKSDIIFIAVKPQDFEELIDDIDVEIKSKVLVSVMAGVGIKEIQKRAKCKNVVRAMPNLPIKVFKGIVGWYASKSVKKTHKQFLKRIFSVFGEGIELKSESQIDTITALSGSGPAYYLYMCDLMKKKAKKMGFDEYTANKIAEKTLIGAANLLEQDPGTAETLYKSVASKGGTTEAALDSLVTNKFGSIINKATDAAKKRSEQINKRLIKKP